MSDSDQTADNQVFIGRQPIFDRHLDIYSYELLYRGSGHNQADVSDQNQSTSSVIINLISEFGFDAATGGKIAFINLSQDFLTGEIPVVLPPERVVLEILEDTVVDDNLLAGLKKLVDQGFSLALDDFIYSREWEPVFPLVDYIKVEIPALSRDEIRLHVEKLKKLNVKLLAEKIESEEEYRFLLDCGFDLFQGYFLAKPRVLTGKTIPANKLSMLELLAELNDENTDTDKLVGSISADVSLCYKMLRYINSAHFALNRKIDSIDEAITYVGLKKLRHWATLITLSGMNDKPDELMKQTIIRANMCKSLAQRLDRPNVQQYYSVGLLSTLDALLDVPMEAVLESLPLSNDIKFALMDHSGEAGEILHCAIAYENADWAETRKIDLQPADIRQCFFKAVAESNSSILNN